MTYVAVAAPYWGRGRSVRRAVPMIIANALAMLTVVLGVACRPSRMAMRTRAHTDGDNGEEVNPNFAPAAARCLIGNEGVPEGSPQA